MTIFVLLAQKIGCDGGLGPFATMLCGLSGGANSAKDIETVGEKLNRLLSSIIGFLTIVGALWFAIQIIIAGFNWISAGGDKNAVSAAQQKITNSLIGIIIVVMAWVIIAVIGQMLGLSILNPGKLLPSLQIK